MIQRQVAAFSAIESVYLVGPTSAAGDRARRRLCKVAPGDSVRGDKSRTAPPVTGLNRREVDRDTDPIAGVDIRQYNGLVRDAVFESFEYMPIKPASGALIAVKPA